MRRTRTRKEGRHGFSLIELLAALAIAAVIITAATTLIHNVALHFDRGTRGVNEGERLILAVERLAADIGSARFVMRASEGSAAQGGGAQGGGTQGGAAQGSAAQGSAAQGSAAQAGATQGGALAFIGEPAAGEQPAKVVFVGGGSVASKRGGEEVVALTAEQNGDLMRLVRRRAPWFGPRTRFEELTLSDPVILLEGKVLIAFEFGRLTPANGVIWSDNWRGQTSLPRFVRLILRERDTGVDLLPSAQFVIRADSSSGCAQGNSAACASSSAPKPRKAHDE
jgi:prepilin-type N-terminal cleavage/methylation domain-containing protein